MASPVPQKKKKPLGHKVRDFLDSVGDEWQDDPQFDVKTWFGAVVSVVIKLVILGLFIYNVAILIESRKVASEGDPPFFNLPTSLTEERLDFPPVDFVHNGTIFFYEKEEPSIQKVELIDNTGYHTTLSSYKDHDPPVVASFYSKYVMNIGETQTETFFDATLRQKTHSTDETMKIAFLDNPKFSTSNILHPHTVYNFVRFQDTQLSTIKPCQLQLWMINEGEFNMTKDTLSRNRTAYDDLITLSTVDSSWDPNENFQESSYTASNNIFVHKQHLSATKIQDLKSKYASKGLDEVSLVDWRFGIAYYNNFLGIAQQETSIVKRKFFAESPGLTGTTLKVRGYVPDIADELPIFIRVMNINGHENMEVVAISGSKNDTTLHVVRDSPVNFSRAATDINMPASAPAAWRCPAHAYNGKTICDCNCGAYDPDCETSLTRVVGCPSDMPFCTREGRCVSTLPFERDPWSPELVAIEVQGDMAFEPGEQYLEGFVGSDTYFERRGGRQCQICPGDSVFDSEPVLQTDGRYMCYGNTDAFFYGDLTSCTGYSDPKRDVCLKIKGETAFPECNGPDCTYKLKLGKGTSIEESVSIQSMSLMSNDRMQLARLTKDVEYRHRASGDLISPLDPQETQLHVFMEHEYPNGWFEEIGPYTILVNGKIAATVKSATRPTLNHVQTLNILWQQDNTQFAYGSKGVILHGISPGQTTFNVTSFGPQLFADLPPGPAAPNYWCAVQTSAASTPSFVAHFKRGYALKPPGWTCPANKWNNGQCDCQCGAWDVDCYRIRRDSPSCPSSAPYCAYMGGCSQVDLGKGEMQETIVLAAPLEQPVPAGALIGCVPRTLSRVPVTMYSTAEIHRTDSAFKPSGRHSSHPGEQWDTPTTLTVETAAFRIPDRAKFASAKLKLVEKDTSRGVDPAWETCDFNTWKPTRAMRQAHYALNAESPTLATCPTVKTATQPPYRAACVQEVKPTYTAPFSNVIPFSALWNVSNDSLDCIKEDSPIRYPEHVFSWTNVYYFTYSQNEIKTENEFAEGLQSDGDEDQDGVRHYWNGMTFVSPSDSVTSGTKMPAQLPLLKAAVTWRLTNDALKYIKTNKPKGWSMNEKDIIARLAKLPDLEITWDLDGVGGTTATQILVLRPGYEYVLSATLSILVTRTDDPWYTNWEPASQITNWQVSVVSTSATKRPLEFYQSQQARVTYSITIDHETPVTKMTNLHTLQTFLNAIGSIAGYTSIAVLIVKYTFKVVRRKSRGDLHQVVNHLPTMAAVLKERALDSGAGAEKDCPPLPPPPGDSGASYVASASLAAPCYRGPAPDPPISAFGAGQAYPSSASLPNVAYPNGAYPNGAYPTALPAYPPGKEQEMDPMPMAMSTTPPL